MANYETDMELINGMRAGESGAYRKLYVEYFTMIRHLVVKNSGNEQDASDLFQEGVVALFENLRKPDFELSATLKTFFYSICRNMWLKQLRGRKKAKFVDYEEAIGTPLLPEPEDLSDQQAKILQSCLKRLGDSCRKLLEQYYYLKKNMTEIAEDMGYSNTNTVKTRKYKCIQQLKKLALVESGGR